MEIYSPNSKTDRYVEIVLSGGLGNQLFGWATAYSLSKKMNAKLILNTSQLNERSFEIPNFDIDKYEISTTQYRSYSITNQLAKRLWILSKRQNHYFEKSFNYQKLPTKNCLTMHGYFQSYRYFWNNLGPIQKQLSNLTNLSSDNFLKLKEEYDEKSYIAVHVRRGDYLHANGYHSILEPSYYKKSLDLIRSRVGDLSVIVFSDDLFSAKKVVPTADLFVGVNEIESPVETLLAISRAKAIIGANSTLSLWAAYLSNTENQLKIFPSTWFGNQEIDTSDLMPQSFIRI